MTTFEEFKKILEEEKHLLPDQSPLEYFVHHNNLHHFEDSPFEHTVEHIYSEYGKSPYMPLSYFRSKYEDGEISDENINKYLKINGFNDLNRDIEYYIIEHLFKFNDKNQFHFNRSENLFYDKEIKKLIKFKNQPQDIWEKLNYLINKFNAPHIHDFHVNNSLGRINKILIPFYSIMIDQGQANIQLIDQLRANPWSLFVNYLETILTEKELKNIIKISPDITKLNEFIYQRYFSLIENIDTLRNIIRNHFQSTPGWAGMILKTSINKEVTPRYSCQLDLSYFLLFRLCLHEVLEKKVKEKKVEIYSDELVREHAFHFHLHHPKYKLEPVLTYETFSRFTPTLLSRIFQQAYEETYGNLILSGLNKQKKIQITNSKYQLFFCIDDREESIRRYIEENSNDIETFGVAGFFGLDMNYQATNDRFPRRMCPPAAVPKFLIHELGEKDKFTKLNQILATLNYDGNTNFIPNLIKNFIFSVFKAISFKFHLYFPRLK